MAIRILWDEYETAILISACVDYNAGKCTKKEATITVGNITTDSIKKYEEIQILIGVLCGLVESKMGIDIYKKANSVVDIGEEKE